MIYDVLKIANLLLKYAQCSEGGDLMTNMKLQKMLYYQQGFHLAFFDTPLFTENIEAWMYGPVVPVVYDNYKSFGKSGISYDKNVDFKFQEEKEEALFNEVYKVYGKYSAIGLMQMTHEESPWKSTKTGEGNVISKESMRIFFKTKLK